MKKILVLHGPNLNLLGTREPGQYGTNTLDEINQKLKETAYAAQYDLVAQQSNSESELIELIHAASLNETDYLIFNPAGLTHTSISLRDALLATQLSFIEVHISNIYARESFRHLSYFSDIADGVVSGFGVYGYQLALQAIIHQFNQ